MSGNIPRGRFVWYELMTTDPEAARSFYPEIVGWGTQPWEHDASYVMWTRDGSPVGAVMTLPEEAKEVGSPPHWMAYIAVPDVDSTANQAKKLGGKLLHGPADIPNVGRFAVIADPQGAVFAAFQPQDETSGPERPPEVGEFSWHELATDDYEDAFGFYSELFGWEIQEEMDMGEHGVYLMYGRPGGPMLGGMFNRMAEMPVAWTYYIKVPDVKKSAEQVKKMGGRVLNGPMEVPGGDWIVQCLDPQGVVFALHSSATTT